MEKLISDTFSSVTLRSWGKKPPFSQIFNYAAEILSEDSLQGGRAGQMSPIFPPLDIIFLFNSMFILILLAKNGYGGQLGLGFF